MIKTKFTVILLKGLSLIPDYTDFTASIQEMMSNFLKP